MTRPGVLLAAYLEARPRMKPGSAKIEESFYYGESVCACL